MPIHNIPGVSVAFSVQAAQTDPQPAATPAGMSIRSVTNPLHAPAQPAAHAPAAVAQREFIAKNAFASDADFERHMVTQLQRFTAGEKLPERELNQLNAWRSNANYLSKAIAQEMQLSREIREGAPHGKEARHVQKLSAPLESILDHSVGKSVFTRDVDFREMQGLLKSERFLSVNERQLNGIGRIRKMADFNRGGAMGTYTRVVSDKRIDQAKTAAAYQQLPPLGIGSIGNSGITITLDGKTALSNISHPLELWHNDRDSAGRILGRVAQAPSEREGAKVGRSGERYLGQRNPLYYKRDDLERLYPLKALNPDRLARIASESHTHLKDILETPGAHTDHNEQVWLTPPSLAAVKAIFIQKQLDRPPALIAKTPDELIRENERHQSKIQQLKERIVLLEQQYRAGSLTHPEMVAGKAPLMSQSRKLEETPYPYKIVDQSARLPKEVRVPSFWKDGNVPAGYEGLRDRLGMEGVALADLITHVSPNTKRADLPAMADEVLQRGKEPKQP